MHKIFYVNIAALTLGTGSLYSSENLTKKVIGWTTPGGTALTLTADGKSWTHKEIKKSGARENGTIGGDYDKPSLSDAHGANIPLTPIPASTPSECATVEPDNQLLSLHHEDNWTRFQELSQLSEEQQSALIRLAEKSKDEEIADLLLACQIVAQSSGTIIEGLKEAKDTRAGYIARISRAIGLSAKDLKLLAQMNLLTASEILDKLSALSTIDQKTLEGMIAQAPQAPTKDLEELVSRFEKAKGELTKFIVLIEAMKVAREAASSSLQAQDTAVTEKTSDSSTCIIV